MLIEIFKNKDGVVGSFRHSWNAVPLNKPIKENVYNIYDCDYKELLIALDHTAVLGTSKDYDFNSGNLYLKIIDNASYHINKGSFLEGALNSKR